MLDLSRSLFQERVTSWNNSSFNITLANGRAAGHPRRRINMRINRLSPVRKENPRLMIGTWLCILEKRRDRSSDWIDYHLMNLRTKGILLRSRNCIINGISKLPWERKIIIKSHGKLVSRGQRSTKKSNYEIFLTFLFVYIFVSL